MMTGGRRYGVLPASAPRPQRFLFLFSDTGGGHRASAQAVKEELGRLYGGVVHFERERRGTARLTKAIAYEKPAEAGATEFEVVAVSGRAEVAFASVTPVW